jgi:hypothetical protein
MHGTVLFVVGSTANNLPAGVGDKAIHSQLGKLGYHVIVENPSRLQKKYIDEEKMKAMLFAKEMVVLSSTSTDRDDKKAIKRLTDLFRNRLIPIVILGDHLLAGMGMVDEENLKPVTGVDSRYVQIIEEESQRLSGLPERLFVSDQAIQNSAIHINKNALKLATLDQAGRFAICFGFGSGTPLGNQKLAAGRRVALLFDDEVVRQLQEDGWRLFDAAIELAGKASTFNDVFRAEWQEIRMRRRKCDLAEVIHPLSPPAECDIYTCPLSPPAEEDVDDNDSAWGSENSDEETQRPPENLVGLALSGGGIRSATFSLGLLQGLREKNLLKIFDYLSTVSGGGYIGGWWSAWLSRKKNDDDVFPRAEQIEPRRIIDYLKNQDRLIEGSLCADVDPIHHLRLFSNYLTPRKGLLSSDTWQAITMLVRNIILTWMVLLPILFAFVLAGQFYFVLQRNSVEEFLFPFQEKIIETQERSEKKRAKIPLIYEAQRQEALKTQELKLKKIDRKETKGHWETTKANQHRTDITNLTNETFKSLDESEVARVKRLQEAPGRLHEEFRKALKNRLLLAAYLLVPMLIWMLVSTIFWMRVSVTPQAIVKLAHTVPGVIFWMLVISVICLSTAYSWRDWHKPYGLFGEGFGSLSTVVKILLVVVWLVGSTLLWWFSLPFNNQNKLKKVFKDYRVGNVFSWLLTLGTTFLVLAGIIALYHSVNNKLDAKFFWVGLLVVLMSGYLWFYSLPQNEEKWEWRKLIHGNKIMRMQSMLIVVFVAVMLVLALSGYGYEIASYLLCDPKSQKAYTDYIAKAGGWATVIAAIAGSIFTAIKASPTGGKDKNESQVTDRKTAFIFAITPILVLVSLAITFAWLARWMLIQFYDAPDHYVEELNKAILVGVILYLFLAIYEIRTWEKIRSILWRIALLIVVALAVYLGITQVWAKGERTIESNWQDWRIYCYLFWLVGTLVGAAVIYRFRKSSRKSLGIIYLASELLYSICFFFITYQDSFRNSRLLAFSDNQRPMKVLVEQSAGLLAGMLCCGIVLIWERRHWDKKTERTLLLIAFTHAVLSNFLVFTFFVNIEIHKSMTMGYLAQGLLFVALSWSVAIGWMSDPNLLSMHMFYKSRLVRAYLGASNPNRKTQEITETAREDDVLLSQLKNCERGAPYHLINTTLNLVGGRDLATAQRSSDYFVFSKLFSGSSRTGYRKNLPEQYMQGQVSLGTAVAISGAAVSPNMGAKTQTAAVAMLLTLLNVRLGYWAPTPNHKLWRSAQASLWPFYMLKEFSSQTNDLSSYCYLTDGGHFDNTGLYSLVQRGCRFIVVSDNGADYRNHFEDLGDAMRRCRIDFKTEISLDISPLFKKKDEISEDLMAQKHFIVGTIEYAEEHLRHLGWKPQDVVDSERRKGMIILIKPSLIKEDCTDVRQYARQNIEFPQQSTSDQWYNEAQFESYRKLGEECAKAFAGFDLAVNGHTDLTRIEAAFHRALAEYENKIEADAQTEKKKK